jgi:phosphatidate cytidylyltransferase
VRQLIRRIGFFAAMVKRILTALLLIPLVLGLLWVGSWGFFSVWLLCGLLMSWEYTAALCWSFSGRVIYSLWLVAFWIGVLGFMPWQVMLVGSFILLGVWLWQMDPGEAFGRVYEAAFGAIYIGFGWGSVGWHFGGKLPYRPEAVVGYLLPVWAADTAAYFVGRTWGRHKIRPRLSPQKSWEGLIAGLIGAAVVGHWSIPLTGDFPWVPGAVVGGLVGLVGFFGDVWESAWKRYQGLKDSGVLLPGHGGLLDRLDAFLWVSPLWWGLSKL